MKKPAAITVTRNALIVGNNSKSYDDKHRAAPVDMRPIRNAQKRVRRAILNALGVRSKPEIAKILAR